MVAGKLQNLFDGLGDFETYWPQREKSKIKM